MSMQEENKPNCEPFGEGSKAMEEFDHWQAINRLMSTVLWPLGLSVCAIIVAAAAQHVGAIDGDFPIYSVYYAIMGSCIIYYFVEFLSIVSVSIIPIRVMRTVAYAALLVVLLLWSWDLIWHLMGAENKLKSAAGCIAWLLFFFSVSIFIVFCSHLANRLNRFGMLRFACKGPEWREKQMKRLRNFLARKVDAFLGEHPSISLSRPYGWHGELHAVGLHFVMTALLTGYFYIGGIEWGDWTIPDEKELRLENIEVPDEENAYIALMALTNLYTVADTDQKTTGTDGASAKEITDEGFVRYYGDPFNSEDGEERAAVRNNPSSPKRAAKILADNAKFFDAFRVALSRKNFKDPENVFKPGVNPSASNYSFRHIIDFARLISLKVQMEVESGNVKEAVEDILSIHSLGQIMAAKIGPHPGAFIQFLVSKCVNEIAYGKMRDFVAMGMASDDMLREFIKQVDEDEAAASANRIRALKAEWESQSLRVDWECNVLKESASYREFLEAQMIGVFEQRHGISWDFILWHSPGFKRLAMHRLEMKFILAEELRRSIARNDLENMEDGMLPVFNPFVIFSPNGLFKLLHTSFEGSYASYFVEASLGRSRTRLILAAEKWRRANGDKNPPTLYALVPDYLAAIPSDPWSKSGEPIKYDAASGVAWSVGRYGKYDYRKIAANLSSFGKDSQEERDTRNFAFRLDGRPIEFRTSPISR